MPLFQTGASSSSSSSTPTLPLPISTAQAKRDDDWEAKKKNRKMSNVLQNKNMRVLITVFAALLVMFFVFSTNTSPSSIRSAVSSRYQTDKSKAGGSSDPTACTTSYDGKKPVTQYVVMVDAGSSGSRVHVYEFNNCQATPQLIKEDFKMMDPGLSSFDTDAQGAAKSLDELMDFAVQSVPEKFRSCAPVAVKATAGLRMLGDDKSNKILDAVRTRLETNYPFPVVENDGVAIMDGSDEGVYAWITANFLLENIGSSEKTPTAAVFDLGGGSTQIVFEPTFSVPNKAMDEGDHKYVLDFGGRHFELYQHSHLGFGLNAAKEQINALIATNVLKESELVNGAKVVNPCLPPKSKATGVKVKVSDSKTITVDMEGPKEPSVAQCRGFAEQILNKQKECTHGPCSFNGVHQPPFSSSFPRDSDMYVFSFFYDRTSPLGMPSSFDLNELKDLTTKVCRGEEAYSLFEANPGAVDELKKNPQWCMELNFMVALLHSGYDIPTSREVKIAKKIKNNELGWCLGASLPLLDMENWKCKREYK